MVARYLSNKQMTIGGELRKHREQIDEIAFRLGGWVELGNRLQMSAEHLRAMRAGGIGPVRRLLRLLRRFEPAAGLSESNLWLGKRVVGPLLSRE